MAYPGGMIPHMTSGDEGLRLYFYGAWPHSYDWSEWKRSKIARIDYLRDGVSINDEGEHATPAATVHGSGSITDTFDGSTATDPTYQFTDDLEERYFESIFPSGGYPDKIEIYQADAPAEQSLPPSAMELRYNGNVISRFMSDQLSQPAASQKYIDHTFDLSAKTTTDYRLTITGRQGGMLTGDHGGSGFYISDSVGSIFDLSKMAAVTHDDGERLDFNPHHLVTQNAWYANGQNTAIYLYMVGEHSEVSYSWRNVNATNRAPTSFALEKRVNSGAWTLLHEISGVDNWTANELKTFTL